MRIAIIPGTNRVGSNSLKIAQQVAEDYRSLKCEVDLLELNLGPEFLAPDAYKNPAPTVSALVQRYLTCDAAVFVIPEYNGSYPGVLKLFVDMLPDKVSFNQRPCAFIGIAAGQFQGLRAVEHFQGVAGYRNALMYPNRVFIGGVGKLIDQDGRLNDSALVNRLRQQAEGFLAFASALKR